MNDPDPHRRISASRQKAAEIIAAGHGYADGRAARPYRAADFETDGERRAYDRRFSEARQSQLTIEDTTCPKP